MTHHPKPNPWNFHNNDHALVSPDQLYQLVYYDMNEIAMGAPLGGLCYLEGNGTKIKIHNWCGGPPVWENKGLSFAIPIWERTALEGTVQKIGIVDLEQLELKIFEKTFRVLYLRSFEGKVVRAGHQNTDLSFDIDAEKIEVVLNLNE